MDQLELLLHQYGVVEMSEMVIGNRPGTIDIVPDSVSFMDMPIWKNTMASIAEEACYEAKQLDSSITYKIGGI
jgi:hypothetical protein